MQIRHHHLYFWHARKTFAPVWWIFLLVQMQKFLWSPCLTRRNITSVAEKQYLCQTILYCNIHSLLTMHFPPSSPKTSLLRLNVHTSLCFYRSLSVRLFLGKLLQFPHLQQRLKPCKLLGLNSFLFLNKYNHSLKFRFLYLFLKFGEFKHLRVIKKWKWGTSISGNNLFPELYSLQLHYISWQ